MVGEDEGGLFGRGDVLLASGDADLVAGGGGGTSSGLMTASRKGLRLSATGWDANGVGNGSGALGIGIDPYKAAKWFINWYLWAACAIK